MILMGRDEVRLKETLSLTTNPAQHIITAVDLLDYGQIAEIIPEVVSEIGKFDGLVNCAGISTTLPLNSLSHEKLNHFLQVNVTGPVNLTRQIVRTGRFSETGGSIIFISSVMGVVGEKGKTLYSITKGALVSAVRSMAVELASKRIRVNSISPGVVETPMSKHAVYSKDEVSLNRIRDLHPLGLGVPDDVANAVVFLLSDASRWITGTNLIVDGGYTAR